MRTRDIKENRFYSNGNRCRAVVFVTEQNTVWFRECQDGPSSWQYDMPIDEFAKWATMEVEQYFKVDK